MERERLAREGLPVGGQEREAKKTQFDQAASDLSEYRRLMSEWDTEMDGRRDLFGRLTEACKVRTDIRKRKAGQITEHLARELDPAVLVIEVDAQPVANKSGLANWLNENLYPAGTRSKEAKTRGYVEDGLLPQVLRDILLGEGELPIVDRASVADGRIDESAAQQYLEHCWGLRQLEPEIGEDELPETWEELPEEIQSGLHVFPCLDGDGGRLNEARLSAVLQLDETLFDDVPEIRLMDRPEEMDAPRPLSELSPGQRCSAILPILLLNGTCPLIIDQPEDNLDSRLIREVVVKILGSMKLKRQVILATHNPNLPVLGDVEQAVVLRAVEHDKCEVQTSGNLDDADVVRSITDIMEGGREAFQYRHSIYQPYWEGPVDREEK